MRRFEEHPRAVAAAQVADHERVLLPGDLRVQRREEHVIGEADITVLAADRGVGAAALEALDGGAAVIEQHEHDRRSGPRLPSRCRRAPRGRRPDERCPTPGAELRPGGDRRPAARAARARPRSGEAASAVGTERQKAARAAPAEVTREGLRARRGDNRRGHDPRPGYPPTPPPGLPAPGRTPRLAAVYAELRAGVVFAAAVGTDGHWWSCSTWRKSTACQSIGQIDV